MAADEDRPVARGDLGEVADRALRRITTAIVIAGGIIGLAVYSRPGPPRYQVVAGDGQVVRIDTRTGSVIACDEARRCTLILRRGQPVGRTRFGWPSRKQDAEPAPALAPAKPATPTGS